MATAAPQLEDGLTCAICLHLFREPVTLPCGHNYCTACIGQWWETPEKDPSEGRCCPECRKPCPDGAELPRNVSLCSLADAVRAGPAPAPSLGPRPAASLGPRPACPRHQRPLELFCRTEGLGVCSECALAKCPHHELALLDAERSECESRLRAGLEVTQQQTAEAKGQLQELQQRRSQIQKSAYSVASMVTSKVTSLLQALKRWEILALRDIQAAEVQALARVRDEERRVRAYLEALAGYDHGARGLLEQPDDHTFLQELQLLVAPRPLGPLSAPRWDEDRHVSGLKDLLSQPCGRLLDEGDPPGAPAEPADVLPMKAPGPPAAVRSPGCPRRRELWQNYRNLTFDPDSANRHFYLSRRHQQVKHCQKPRGAAGPSSFEVWQVQCAQSFHAGRHYWEVHLSGHSVTLGVAYPGLARNKLGPHTDNIGRGPGSWGLCVQEDRTQAWHDGKAQGLPRVSGRLLGLDLDLTSGNLTFYSLEPKTQPLYTFHTVFTQPLRPVFWLLEGRTLTLCHQPEATFPPELQGETMKEGADPGARETPQPWASGPEATAPEGPGGAVGPGQKPPDAGARETPQPQTSGPEATAPAGPAPESSTAPGTPTDTEEGTGQCVASDSPVSPPHPQTHNEVTEGSRGLEKIYVDLPPPSSS